MVIVDLFSDVSTLAPAYQKMLSMLYVRPDIIE